MNNISKKILAIPTSLCFFVPSSFAMGMEGDGKENVEDGFIANFESRDGIEEGECRSHSMSFDADGNGLICLVPELTCDSYRYYLLRKFVIEDVPCVQIFMKKQGNNIENLNTITVLNTIKGDYSDEIKLTIEGKDYTFSSNTGSTLRNIFFDQEKLQEIFQTKNPYGCLNANQHNTAASLKSCKTVINEATNAFNFYAENQEKP